MLICSRQDFAKTFYILDENMCIRISIEYKNIKLIINLVKIIPKWNKIKGGHCAGHKGCELNSCYYNDCICNYKKEKQTLINEAIISTTVVFIQFFTQRRNGEMSVVNCNIINYVGFQSHFDIK